MSQIPPKTIAKALDLAVSNALSAVVDPIDDPYVSVNSVLEDYGVPEDIRRSIILSACHAYENVMMIHRESWQEKKIL